MMTRTNARTVMTRMELAMTTMRMKVRLPYSIRFRVVVFVNSSNKSDFVFFIPLPSASSSPSALLLVLRPRLLPPALVPFPDEDDEPSVYLVRLEHRQLVLFRSEEITLQILSDQLFVLSSQARQTESKMDSSLVPAGRHFASLRSLMVTGSSRMRFLLSLIHI